MEIFNDRVAMARAIIESGNALVAAKTVHATSVAIAEANTQVLACAVRDIINDHADDPKRLSANDAARQAVIEGRTQNERLALHNAETDRRAAAASVECAEVEWRSLRAAAAILFGSEAR